MEAKHGEREGADWFTFKTGAALGKQQASSKPAVSQQSPPLPPGKGGDGGKEIKISSLAAFKNQRLCPEQPRNQRPYHTGQRESSAGEGGGSIDSRE